jgi:hypothetical protein
MRIVERMIEKGAITNREMNGIFGLLDEGSRKEISKVIGLDVVRKKVEEGRLTMFWSNSWQLAWRLFMMDSVTLKMFFIEKEITIDCYYNLSN